MFLINKDKKKKGEFADSVRALSELLTVGTRLATMAATCLFIYIVRDGLAEAFTKDFVRVAVLGGALLAVGAAYTAYKIADRMAEAAEEAAIAIAERAKAEKEAEALRKQRADEKNDQHTRQMQAQFQMMLATMSNQGRLPAPKAGTPSAMRRAVLDVARNNKKPSKKDAFVV